MRVILLKGIELLGGKPLRSSNVREAKDLSRKFAKTIKTKILRHFVPQDDNTVSILQRAPFLENFIFLLLNKSAYNSKLTKY